MSATSEMNGNSTEPTPTTRNRVRGTMPPVTKFQRLFALASKAERKAFTARRDTEEGTFALRMDGFPESLDSAGVAKLALNGAKLAGVVRVGAASGRFSGVVLGPTAAEMVTEMTQE